jgi:uncharacterized membrane protein YoaK (UPF0700 family)
MPWQHREREPRPATLEQELGELRDALWAVLVPVVEAVARFLASRTAQRAVIALLAAVALLAAGASLAVLFVYYTGGSF